MRLVKWDLILVATDINFYDLQYLTWIYLKWHVKTSRRRMGGAERVVWRIISEVRWDQYHLIPLLSHQAPKSYFADLLLLGFSAASMSISVATADKCVGSANFKTFSSKRRFC